ncbi:hypothetical protein CR513_26539, partial [Mucuna pruriens]
MADITSKEEYDDEEKSYQKLILRSSTLSIEVNEQLKEEVIDLRQSLAKFVNGSENLKKILKHKRHPYDKTSIGYDKKSDLKKDKFTSHCLNNGRFKHFSNDCRDHPKGLSKPTRTNKKRPKRIWIPKNIIVPIAYLLDSRKEKPVMVPRQWLLMSYDGRKINWICLTNQSVTYLVFINNDQWTWHKKLVHASLRLTSKLKRHNLVRGLPSFVYKWLMTILDGHGLCSSPTRMCLFKSSLYFMLLFSKKIKLLGLVKLKSQTISAETETKCVLANRRNLDQLKPRPSRLGQDEVLSWLTLF